MNLPSPLQLQTVFDHAQKLIGYAQLVEVSIAEMAFIIQLLQRQKRATGTEPWLFAAIYTLKALRQELDIANAAAIELYINGWRLPARGQRPPPLLPNLAPRIGGGLHGDKVDVRGIDARLNGANQCLREINVSRRMPRFDQRLQLPIVRCASVIIERLPQGDSRLTFMSLRPQAQINAEHCAFSGR